VNATGLYIRISVVILSSLCHVNATGLYIRISVVILSSLCHVNATGLYIRISVVILSSFDNLIWFLSLFYMTDQKIMRKSFRYRLHRNARFGFIYHFPATKSCLIKLLQWNTEISVRNCGIWSNV